MSVSVPPRRIDARPLVAISVALMGLAVLLPAPPAYAGERSVFRDVVVESNGYADKVSTIFGDVRVRGPVAGDVHSARGDVEIEGRCGGDVNAGFGDVTVREPVEGDVDAGFGDVYVHSRVGGVVDADHGDVYLRPGAELAARPRVGNGQVYMNDGAEVYGPKGAGMMSDFGSGKDRDFFGFVGWFFAAAGFAACAVLAAVISPKALSAAARRAEEAPGRSLFFGLASIPAVLLLSVVLAVSVVGVPLLLLLAPAYLALVFYGALVAAFFVGRKVVLATGHYRSGNALAAAVGALLVSAATVIPFLGDLLLFALASLGTGAAILALISRRRVPRTPYPSYEAYVHDRRDA